MNSLCSVCVYAEPVNKRCYKGKCWNPIKNSFENFKHPAELKIEQLRELVYNEDIPHPTIPEYKEHHESIQKILRFIDGKSVESVENVDKVTAWFNSD